MRRLTTVLAALLALSVLAGCGSGDDEGGDATGKDVTLRVFAAASLTETFTELAGEFEDDNRSVKVELNFGPSSGLAEQIGSGAPADVFASASSGTMKDVVAAGDAEGSRDFATNSMEIATPPDNPAGVKVLDDLAKPAVKVALCQPQVPCGEVAAEVFEKAGITVKPVTEEVDVKAVLTKVSLGEVDAGVVYVTDVLAAGKDVSGVEIPADKNASTTYPIAPLTASENPEVALDFVELILSEAGAEVLQEAGFETP